MAAATVASGYPVRTVEGDHRAVYYKLTAPADGDTLATGLSSIVHVGITWISTTISTADAVGVGSISGGTVTFEVVGTANDLLVRVLGN